MLTFERATAADVDIIFAECRRLIEKYELDTAENIEAAIAWTRRKIEKLISEYTAVYENGEKVAFYRLCESDGKTELDDLFVLSLYRNRGIGTAILKKVCAEHVGEIFLYVFTENTGAQQLYEAFGFKESKTVSPTRIIMKRRALI